MNENIDITSLNIQVNIFLTKKLACEYVILKIKDYNKTNIHKL